jgi:hypothetical protein
VFPLSLPSSLPPTLFPSQMKNAPFQDPPNMPSGLFLLRMHAPTHLRTYVYICIYIYIYTWGEGLTSSLLPQANLAIDKALQDMEDEWSYSLI